MKFTSLVALIGATYIKIFIDIYICCEDDVAARFQMRKKAPGMKTNNDSPAYLSTHDQKDNIINATNI